MQTVHPRLRELLATQAAGASSGSIETRTAGVVRSKALEILELRRPPAALHAVWDLPASAASGVDARVYRPQEGRTPLIVYFHGGGFVIDGAGHDRPLRDLAAATGCTIVAPNVRLAPEHPFPAAVHDALRFARWVCDRGAAEVGSSSAIGIAGDSSGGNLAGSRPSATSPPGSATSSMADGRAGRGFRAQSGWGWHGVPASL